MKNIYIDVEKSIKDLQKIFENADDRDEKLQKFNQEASEVFQKLEFESLKELESLKNNEEWENFTIAFYGETNVGKSTLIECLRLFFKEQSKMDQQERFKRLYAEKNHRGSGHALTGEKYGIKVEESLKDKIRNAMENVADQKLKVALVGGFSEGKTSIAAAWIDRLDKSMKIDHKESSDAVKIYNIDDEIELVDTPGLFGFKEKITDSGKIERYKDITKKYISEAHLILYALNPSNPIKESHKDDLNWLFRTLNLLSRTIFVISRFDEEADIEDEEDYNKRFKIKKENVQNRLDDLISLSEKEKEGLIIVAVAANPYDLGVEH